MAKAEWGLKRTCQSCGTRFYDMGHDPILCPKCGTKFDPETVLKSKRTTKAVAERVVPAPVTVAEEPAEVVAEDDAIEADETEEEEVIEDTSELGEDDEDVAEVIENVDEEEER